MNNVAKFYAMPFPRKCSLVILVILAVGIGCFSAFMFIKGVLDLVRTPHLGETLAILVKPGISLRRWLIISGHYPWEVSRVVVSTGLGLALLFWIFSRRWWLSIGALGLVLLFCWLSISLYEFRKHDYGTDDLTKLGYGTQKFVRHGPNGKQTLLFVGVQHAADLAYYRSLDAYLMDLANQGFVFWFEDSDALDARPDVARQMDVTQYSQDLDPRRFYVDLIHQPSAPWPGTQKEQWERLDLGASDREVLDLTSIKGGHDWCIAMFAARDDHLTDVLINKETRPKVAVVYGFQHLLSISDRLVAGGYDRAGPISIYPEGRKAPGGDVYCATVRN